MTFPYPIFLSLSVVLDRARHTVSLRQKCSSILSFENCRVRALRLLTRLFASQRRDAARCSNIVAERHAVGKRSAALPLSVMHRSRSKFLRTPILIPRREEIGLGRPPRSFSKLHLTEFSIEHLPQRASSAPPNTSSWGNYHHTAIEALRFHSGPTVLVSNFVVQLQTEDVSRGIYVHSAERVLAQICSVLTQSKRDPVLFIVDTYEWKQTLLLLGSQVGRSVLNGRSQPRCHASRGIQNDEVEGNSGVAAVLYILDYPEMEAYHASTSSWWTPLLK